jgi:PKD repeat protein
MTLLPILIALTLLPLNVFSGGEVDLKQYVSKDVVFVGETVTFGIGNIPIPGITVKWDFGDGSPEVSGWPVTHTYDLPGEFQVTASVTYTSGEEVPTIPTSIRVMATENEPPLPQATVSERDTVAGMSITFDARASSDPDGEIIRYLWDFDDGTTSNEITVTHSYSHEGLYHIILTVTDDGQMDASTILTVSVSAVPSVILPGIDRAIPQPRGIAPNDISPLNYIDLGVWEPERFPFAEFPIPVKPPFQIVAISNRDWLVVEPTEYVLESGPDVTMMEIISIRNTSMLPRAHLSWGLVTLVINGAVIDVPVSAAVRSPDRDISAEVWALLDELRSYLAEQEHVHVLAYSPRYPNGADIALGLITEYILEEGYDGEMPRSEFVVKVAEMLMDVDQNGDGFVGFTDVDRGLGVKLPD